MRSILNGLLIVIERMTSTHRGTFNRIINILSSLERPFIQNAFHLFIALDIGKVY